MPNRGAFQGKRKEFVVGEKPAYAAGVQGGYAADALALIQRRYFKRWPVLFPHDQEQSPAFLLSAVNDEAPDEEYQVPDEESMEPDAYAKAMTEYGEYQRLLKFRKAQIKRWMAYQYLKDHDMDPRESGLNNPYRILLHKLTGSTEKKLRQKTPANVWRRSHRDDVEAEIKARAVVQGATRKTLASLRETVAKDLFNRLSCEEKEEYVALAKEEHAAILEQWDKDMKSPFSTSPEDRQRCIQGLVRFLQPITDLVMEATGLMVTVIAGGPEPANSGRLSMISVHSGTTVGDVKMNFGRAERERYKKYIVPIFGTFLQRCFTPEECHRRALPDDEGFDPLETMELDAAGVNFDSLPLLPLPTPSNPQPLPTTQPPAPDAPRSPPPAEPTRSPSPPCSALPSRLPSPHRLPHPAPNPRSGTPHPSNSPSLVPVVASPVDTPVAPPPPHLPAVATDPMPHQPLPADRTADDAPIPPIANAPAQSTPSATPANTQAPSISSTTVAASKKRQLNRASGDPPPKRKKAAGRKAGATAADDRLETPPGSPKWLTKCLTLFQAADLATVLQENQLKAKWTQLLEAWVAFEVQEGFRKGKPLPAKSRPIVVHEWIKRARNPSYRPKPLDAARIQREFTTWWASLQPTSRDSGAGGDGSVQGSAVEDWTTLKQPGSNGIVSAVAALFYSGLGTSAVDVRNPWAAAVDNGIYVLSLASASS